MNIKLILNPLRNSYSLRLFANISRLIVDKIAEFFIALGSSAVRKTNKKKSLLVLKTGAIGDFIIFSGILDYIRNLYPEDEWDITLAAAPGSKLLANFLKKDVLGSDRLFDFFIPIDEQNFSWNLFYRYKTQLALASNQYDLVISPIFPRYRDESQILFISKSEQKIGFGLDNNSLDLEIERNNHKSNTKLLESLPGWVTETDLNAHAIKMLGYEGKIDAIPRWKIPEDAKNTARQTLNDLGIISHMAIICPGAGSEHRVWPAAKMANVIDHLWDRYGIVSIVCGSPAEQSISAEIRSHIKATNAVCLCGKTNLVELAAIISISRLCVSMDSGPAHLA
jgi:ADP-heptose:LPS heptosyltransferase